MTNPFPTIASDLGRTVAQGQTAVAEALAAHACITSNAISSSSQAFLLRFCFRGLSESYWRGLLYFLQSFSGQKAAS